MKNQIRYLASRKMLPASDPDGLTVVVDGIAIDTYEKFLRLMEKEFQFPTSCDISFHIFMDWICDLSWFNYTSYSIVIKNYSYFMRENYDLKCTVMHCFQTDILPFWEEGVARFVIGGVVRPFNVYMIDEVDDP